MSSEERRDSSPVIAAADDDVGKEEEEEEYGNAVDGDAALEMNGGAEDAEEDPEPDSSPEELAGMVFEAARIGRVDVIAKSLERATALFRNGGGGDAESSNGRHFIDGGGFTPLHVACAHRNVDCVRALLRYSSLVPAKARNSEGLLAIECCSNDASVLRAFAAELLQRIATGDLEGARDLLEGGVDASAHDGGPDESTMLHWAASFGQGPDIVSLLVEFGCDVNAANNKGLTPLHEACKDGHVATAQALLDKGASLTICDPQNRVPLDLAPSEEVSEAVGLWAKRIAEGHSPAKALRRGQQSQPVDALAASEQRVRELEIVKEENEELVKMLRTTIDGLLEEKGLLSYIKKLKEEIRLMTQTADEESILRARLEKLYIASDAQLETAAKENALLRSAVHDKENRLLELLEEQNARGPFINPVEVMDKMVVTQVSTPQPRPSMRSRHSTFGSVDSEMMDTPLGNEMDTEKRKQYDELKTERDMLARELERERRDRYAEARMHLQYANQLRKELQRTQQQLSSRTAIFQHELSKVHKGNQGTLRAILNAVWRTIFPAEEHGAIADALPEFDSPRPKSGEFPNAPDVANGDQIIEETLV